MSAKTIEAGQQGPAVGKATQVNAFEQDVSAIDGLHFFAVDENPDAFNLSPTSLDGTTVRINLIVEDPDATAAQAIAAGAREIFPVADQPYGLRQGRVADPDGHHWLIGRPLEG